MKAFNIKEWNTTHREVVTKEGTPVRILCTDLKSKTPVVGALSSSTNESVFYFDENGKCIGVPEYDLFFKPTTRKGWIIIYNDLFGKIVTISDVFKTEEEARDNLGKYAIKVIEISWEEE